MRLSFLAAAATLAGAAAVMATTEGLDKLVSLNCSCVGAGAWWARGMRAPAQKCAHNMWQFFFS
jgi:hypothetical protein